MPRSLTDNPHHLERDACGIGFVASATGRPSRAVLDLVLEALTRVRHRGAVAADHRTGDGAGVLLPLPRALVPEGLGLAMVFARGTGARAAVEEACVAEGILALRSWRSVPVDPDALGPEARASAPRIEQAARGRRARAGSARGAPSARGLLDPRCARPRLRAERVGVDRDAAPGAEREDALRHACLLDCRPCAGPAREHHRQAEPLRHERPRQREQHAGPVAGAVIGGDGTAVPHACQRLQHQIEHGARRPASSRWRRSRCHRHRVRGGAGCR